MGMTDKSLCDSCTNIGCEFQSGIVRTKCAFYMPPQLEPDNCGNYVVQDSTTKNDIRDNRVKNELNRVKDELEPTTKNDLPHCQHTDEEIAKSFIEDVEAVKDQLHTKNDLGVDCISRKSVITIIQNHWWNCRDIDKLVNELPPVTPQELRWIPVTERLPEETFGCLVTVWDANPKTGEEFENILPELVGYDGETWNGADGKPIAFEVVAWTPLPEPYKEDAE